MYPIQNRTSWSTEIKILCQQGLEVALPEQVLKAIPSSNFYRWKKERDDKYIGADLNILAKGSHDELIRYAEAGQLKKVIAGLFKIQDVYRGIVQKVKGIPNQMRESKEQIVDTIQELKSTVGLENVLEAFDMSRATYQRWLLDVKVACDGSYFQWCVKQNPLQVSRPEMEKMKELLTEGRFLYWPISSLAAFARREGTLHLCDTTFYKYRRLLGIVRPKAKTPRSLSDF
jgi:putative transposase